MSGRSSRSPILLDEEEELVKEEAAEVFCTMDKLLEERRAQKAQEAKAAKVLAEKEAKHKREFAVEMAQQESILHGLQNTLAMLRAYREREADAAPSAHSARPAKRARHSPPKK